MQHDFDIWVIESAARKEISANMFAYQKPKDIDPLLLSPQQASRALAISERTLFTLTKSGEVPHIRIGKLVRYSVDGLRKYIEASEKKCGEFPKED
jgi:excisionase family DNA binding protein